MKRVMPGLRFNVDRAAKFLRHDAMNNLKPQPGARSLRLGSEEWLKDARQHVRPEYLSRDP